jgi:hypothetical protein
VGAAEALGGALRNRAEDALGILIEFDVPDAQDRPAFLREIRIAALIPLGFGMLAAVQFNHELCLAARKIGKVRTDRQLARELGAKARDHRPQLRLMAGCMRAKGSGALSLLERNAAAHT